MLFNSLEFLLFLPIVFILYWFVFREPCVTNPFVSIIVNANVITYCSPFDYEMLYLQR